MSKESFLPYYIKLSSLIKFSSGVPYWNKNVAANARIGDEAGAINHLGYRMITCTIDGKAKKMSSSRIHWFIANGSIPPNCIDHINNNKLDDRLENLRLATIRENTRNRTPSKSGSSRFLGVCWCSIKLKWRANIYNNGKYSHLGYFKIETDAANS